MFTNTQAWPKGSVLAACVAVVLVAVHSCIVYGQTYIYTHIRSNGRIEVRKLCTINNGAKCRHIDINIIPDLNQYFYVKNYPDIHNRRINCSCVVGSPFMYWLYIYIYLNNT